MDVNRQHLSAVFEGSGPGGDARGRARSRPERPERIGQPAVQLGASACRPAGQDHARPPTRAHPAALARSAGRHLAAPARRHRGAGRLRQDHPGRSVRRPAPPAGGVVPGGSLGWGRRRSRPAPGGSARPRPGPAAGPVRAGGRPARRPAVLAGTAGPDHRGQPAPPGRHPGDGGDRAARRAAAADRPPGRDQPYRAAAGRGPAAAGRRPGRDLRRRPAVPLVGGGPAVPRGLPPAAPARGGGRDHRPDRWLGRRLAAVAAVHPAGPGRQLPDPQRPRRSAGAVTRLRAADRRTRGAHRSAVRPAAGHPRQRPVARRAEPAADLPPGRQAGQVPVPAAAAGPPGADAARGHR